MLLFEWLTVRLMVKLAAWRIENCQNKRYNFAGDPAGVGKRFSPLELRMNKVSYALAFAAWSYGILVGWQGSINVIILLP